MSSFDSNLQPSNNSNVRVRARLFMLIAIMIILMVTTLAALLIMRSNIEASSYDPLLGAWKSVDGKTTIEFTIEKTMVEKKVGFFGSQTYKVRVDDPNTLILSAPDGTTRQVDWLVSEEGVLVLVSGESALTYRR